MFDAIDRIFYINLDSRPDRKLHIDNVLLQKMCIQPSKIERIAAVKEYDVQHVYRGCSKSHLLAIRKAIEHNYNTICILEDDFDPLVDDLPCRVSTCMELFSNFDVIMLGMTPIRVPDTEHKGIVQVRQCLAMPGYIVSRKYFKTMEEIFQTALTRDVPIDLVTQHYQANGNWYGFFPAISRQLPGYSDIERRHVNYDYLTVQGYMIQK